MSYQAAMKPFSVLLKATFLALCGICGTASVALLARQSATSTPDIRPQVIVEALKQWPSWDDDTRRRIVLTGRKADLIRNNPVSATIGSGWTDEQAQTHLKDALSSLQSGTVVQLDPSHSPLPESGVSYYVYNPLVVGNFALVQADRPYTGSYTHVLEWRGHWVPVAIVLGPVF